MTEVACRECWQCRTRKVDDWVGRNIAESKTSVASHFVTLTYGRDRRYGSVDHARAAVLTYSDIQKWLKTLRKTHGYKFKYFCMGENGAEKGRAHWHLMMYWEGRAPAVELDRDCIVQGHWDHGFSKWKKPTHEAIRYVCKYILKDIGQQRKPAMSKKPPLGNQYFRELAARYVDAGLAPQDYFYEFPEATRNGQRIKFMMADKTAENFIADFLDQWREKYGGRPYPASEIIEEQRDRWARAEGIGADLRYAKRPEVTIPTPSDFPADRPFGFKEPELDHIARCWFIQNDKGEKLWWTWDKEQESIAWRKNIRAAAEKPIRAEARPLTYRDIKG